MSTDSIGDMFCMLSNASHKFHERVDMVASGLRPGDPVVGSGKPLSISLGPALLGHIFDGLLRPLKEGSPEIYFQAGHRAAAPKRFHFEPRPLVGQEVSPGTVLERAVLAMVICYPLGLAIGAASERVIVEHVTTKNAGMTSGGEAPAVDDERAPA